MTARDYMDSARYAQAAYPRIPYQKPEHEKLMEFLLRKPVFDWDAFVDSNYRQLMKHIENEIRGGMNMEKKFTKKDLRSGYVVEFRSGHRRLVTRAGMFTQILVNPATGAWNYLASGWRDDLTANDDKCRRLANSESRNPTIRAELFDIVKVWGLVNATDHYDEVFLTASTEHRDLLWEREPEAKKLTVDEISKLLGYKVEVVGTGK